MTGSDPVVTHLAGALLALGSVAGAVHGVRMMRAGLAGSDALRLVRGIRVLILGFVSGLAALAVGSGHAGFAVVGVLILAEEIYETGTLAAIIRLGERAGSARGDTTSEVAAR